MKFVNRKSDLLVLNKDYVEQQLKELRLLLKESDKRVAIGKRLPNIRVKVSKSNGCNQYYYINPDTKKLVYVKKEDLMKVARIIQRDYNIDVNKAIRKQIDKLEKFIANYDFDAIDKVYEKMPSARQQLTNPIILNDEQYVLKWMAEHPAMQNTFPEEGKYKTNRGELVRSKSEKIIADTLDRYGIPYQYEPFLELGNSSVYPDFAVLNLKKRKTLYWEHLGIVSENDYATKNFKKLQMYEKNGYYLGTNLIITMESDMVMLDIKNVEEKINELLL